MGEVQTPQHDRVTGPLASPDPFRGGVVDDGYDRFSLGVLFQIVEIEDATKPDGFKIISLFEEAEAVPDGNGLWKITLTCTPSAREYIFNIEDLGYLRYRLKNVIELKSRYSYAEAPTSEQAHYKYIALKVAEIKRRNQEKKINNRFAYLRKLMQKDMETKAEKETTQQLAVARGTQAFRNFTERTDNHYIEKILEQYKQH